MKLLYLPGVFNRTLAYPKSVHGFLGICHFFVHFPSEKEEEPGSAPRGRYSFLLLVGLINGYIQRDISPAILCPFGPIKHFLRKFGMKSAIIGLSRA
jgi:hypothetical protein